MPGLLEDKQRRQPAGQGSDHDVQAPAQGIQAGVVALLTLRRTPAESSCQRRSQVAEGSHQPPVSLTARQLLLDPKCVDRALPPVGHEPGDSVFVVVYCQDAKAS